MKRNYHFLLFCYRFIYSDRIRLKGVASTLAVCALASQLKITALLAACCSYIKRKVSPFTVCQVLKFIADCQYELPELQESCLKILKKNTELVLDCPEFLQCDRFILELIVQQPESTISSELVLINACEKWSEHQNGTATHIEALGSVRQYLRFLSLSASQFAEL
ncbi:hypothetical protein B566_EDAN009641 [Ephemera danica]|nr:hypothetical protein B566_EDAN009641 [Ephemera danica]